VIFSWATIELLAPIEIKRAADRWTGVFKVFTFAR
jgi:hypothetical protein